MKKLFSLLLALCLICALIPMSAMALKLPTNIDLSKPITPGKPPKQTQAEVHKPLSEIKKPVLSEPVKTPDDDFVLVHDPITQHEKLTWNCDTKYHWKECGCGARLSMERHVDPKDATNDYCICGYHFSSNADLVTLWVRGCPGIKYFDKNKTEYKLNAYTYKDVKEIKISTRTHDSEATVELPEDLTLKEGENKFEVKVTSENQKVTKVYTLIINKEAKK